MGDLLYFDFNVPLSLYDFMKGLTSNFASLLQPGSPQQAAPATANTPANRMWFSQPRPGSDDSTEVITVNFKLPLSVSELGFEALRVPCQVECWYQDRSNNWVQVLDGNRIPVKVTISGSATVSWYKYHTSVYPIVAKALRFHITRTPDPATLDMPYVTGLRNGLIRRNVYDRSDGTQPLEDEQDAVGNVWSKYIKDWDATKAYDNDPNTFWKCAPMPDPAAVVCLYLDVRGDDGSIRTVDRLWIDPVYTGQHLNLYYSSDDAVGTLNLSPITIVADQDENTDWKIGRGRTDDATGSDDAFYRWPMSIGPLVTNAMWLGVEWAPNFPTSSGPPQNPVLLRSVQPSGTTTGWHPGLYYDVGAGEFVLEFTNGASAVAYGAGITSSFDDTDVLQVVAGWSYGPDTVHIKVTNRAGETLASLDGHPTDLPQLVSIDGEMEMFDFRGTMTATVVKKEAFTRSSEQFLANAVAFVNPDPVLPDQDGNIPSTTLDNAVYAVDWTSQEHGSGGAHETFYADKIWTPIWRDFVTEKAMLFFPQPVNCKYIKLEFSQLSAEPYPVYDSGIEVRYKTYPVSVLQQSSIGPRLYTGTGGFLGLGSFISINGVRSVNWLNPFSILNAANAVFGPTVNPVQVNIGPGVDSQTLPNTADSPVSETFGVEIGSEYVYRREQLDPYVLASDQYQTIIKAEGLMKIADFTDVPWQDIEAANVGAISHKQTVGALPVRGTDWWIFPGQTLKIPANIMTKLTDTSTVTERGLTLEHRVRFTTTSVHQYDYKTLTRDSAMAYFAGVREVFPLTTTYIDGQDPRQFVFSTYSSDEWVYTNVSQDPSGPVTTAADHYEIENPNFDLDLSNWSLEMGDWERDVSQGHWYPGSAHATANGHNNYLHSTKFDVNVGDDITVSAYAKWAALTVTNATPGFGVLLTGYDANDAFVSDIAVGQQQYADWSTHTGGDWTLLSGSGTVPSGVTHCRVRLFTTNNASGDVWFDNVILSHTTPTDGEATVFKDFTTQSTFSKLHVDFRDSGLVRSNAMWADADPLDDTNIPNSLLAYYVETIPSTIPAGFWGDMFAEWADSTIDWGEPHAVVSINIDGNRVYQGHRVLHFFRAAHQGEAGVKVRQWTNYVRGALARIGCVFYKPTANSNQITLRLRRISDGTFVHEETFTADAGRWVQYTTTLFELPDTDDQIYTVELTLNGDEEDELYLSDLYTEVAHIRYYIRLGGIGSFLHEVTDLRYADQANVVTTSPVDEAGITVQILSPKGFAYGATVTPFYLK